MNNLPTPFEILADPISIVIIAVFAGLFLWEELFPGRKQPHMPGWKLKGIAMFFIYFYVSTYLPLIWDQYLLQYQLFDLTGLNLLWGSLAGVLLYEFGVYVWHRAMHKNNLLWRIFHQMHHSAERVDVPGAFYFSIFDMVGFTLLGSLCLALIVGISPQANTIALLTFTFLGMFQHANIKTPRWLGYIVQRPESHTVHHAKGIHAYNYSDLPLFDIIFGTFRNPRSFEYETGFYPGASEKIWQMHAFKDVSKESR